MLAEKIDSRSMGTPSIRLLRSPLWFLHREDTSHREHRGHREAIRLSAELRPRAFLPRTVGSHSDALPGPVLAAGENRVADLLGLEGVPEGRAARLTLGRPFEEVPHVVHEAVLVADLQARHPPLVHVRVLAVGDVDRPPAAELSFVPLLKKI